MTLVDQIKRNVIKLPAEKQQEVLDFVTFLQSHYGPLSRGQQPLRPLKNNPVFGLWKGRGVDGVEYQRQLRSEWDEQA